MKHAFLISVHTNFEQIKLLVESLKFGDIFIHVDLKSQDLFEKLVQYYGDSTNVYIITSRVSVNWSGFSQVQATLNLFETVRQSKIDFDYVHFISGQDLLLLSEYDLNKFIVESNKGEFIDVHDIGSYWWRMKCYSFFRENPKNRTFLYRLVDIILRLIQCPFIRRKNFENMNLYKGSQWFSISFECMKYILETLQDSDYIGKFKYTACPDEHFFQILIMNSKFKDKVLKNNYRYIVFEGLNTSPMTLKMENYDDFMNGKYMFARKFDMKTDGEVIEKVLKNRVRERI